MKTKESSKWGYIQQIENSRTMEEQINEQIQKNYKKLQELASTFEGINGVATGFHALDKMISGLSNGNLVTIAAVPSMGSTSFALSMLVNIAVERKEPSLYVSLSMTKEELVNRLIINVCDIPGEKIKNGQLSPYEWGQLDCKIKELYNSPLFIYDEPFMHIYKMVEDIRDCVKNNGIKIVVIDYLQRIYSQFSFFENRYLEINYFTRMLKSLALELDIPIVVLSQINRNIDHREGIDGKRPILSDLRDSGTIEGDSDMVIFIHRPDYYHVYQDEKGNDLRGMAEVIVAKNRNGAVGDVLLRFRGEYARFQNPDDDIRIPMPGYL